MINNMSKQKGFTLIELVMVIVIIGILAAVALPKFANLTTQAYTAANRGIGGALASGAAIAHAAWIAAGSTGTSVTLDGSAVSVNVDGWPDGGGLLAPSSTNCATMWSTLLNDAPTVNSTSCAATTGACYVSSSAGAVCTFAYYNGGTAVAGTNITYNVTSGLVTITP